MKDFKRFLLSLLTAEILIVFMYIIFHELGHTLVAAICGAEITDFSILTAHMSYVGGNFNQVTYSLFNAAGMLLPVIVCLLVTLIYNRKVQNMFYRCFVTAFVVMTACSVTAWIIVPLLYIYSIPPAGDDVTKFLIISRWNPYKVIFYAVLIIAAQIVLALFKGVFKSFVELVKMVRKETKAK